METTKKYKIEESEKSSKRIIALKDFTTIDGRQVKAGDKGGYVKSEKNLSQEGNCWLYDDACAIGDAEVSGDAVIKDCSYVIGKAKVRDRAIISGDAIIQDNALVIDSAKVSDAVVVRDDACIANYAEISGNALIKNSAQVKEFSKVTDNAVVDKYAIVRGSATIAGYSQITGFAEILGDTCTYGNVTLGDAVVISNNNDFAFIPKWNGHTLNLTFAKDKWFVKNRDYKSDFMDVEDWYWSGHECIGTNTELQDIANEQGDEYRAIYNEIIRVARNLCTDHTEVPINEIK